MKRLIFGYLLCGFITAPSCFAAEDFLRQGIAAYQQGKYSEAIGYFGAAKGTQSGNPLLHYYMGNTLIQMKAPGDALREYKLARDLSPGSKMAALCDAAIASLEQAKAATQPKVFQKRPAEQKWRMPQVIFYFCSCPMCSTVAPVAEQIYADNKNNLVVLLVAKGANDERTLSLCKKYDLSSHPTVLLINEYGVLTKRFTEWVNTSHLKKESAYLGQAAVAPAPTSAEERAMAAYRKAQMDELFEHVRREETRVRQERMRIDADTKAQMESISKQGSRSYYPLDSQTDNAAQREKIAEEGAMRKDAVTITATRLKMDWFVAAEKNIEKEEKRLKNLSDLTKTRAAATPQGK